VSESSNPEKSIEKHSRKRQIYYQTSALISIILFVMWGYIQFFAVSVLLIPIIFIPVIYLIYSIVDGLNDPILGYLTDKSKKFTAKYGKRYPWIMIGAVFSPIFLVLCFIPVFDIRSNKEMALYAAAWLIIMMCIYETFLTLREISHVSLFPDLFRDPNQRANVAGIGMFIVLMCQIFASVSIPLIIAYLGGAYNPNAYIGAVIVVAIINYALLLPLHWGVRETEEMKEVRIKLETEEKIQVSVKDVLIRIFKDRDWMAFLFAFLCWAIAGACILAGVNFFVLHYLGLGIEATILPMLAVLLLGIITIPLWVYLPKKVWSIKRTYLVGLIASAIPYILLLFVTDYVGFIIVIALVGIGYSANWGVVYSLVQAEAIDNAVVKTGKREEASYMGVMRVFSAFSWFFQTLIFVIVWTLTGYIPAKGANQTELAKFGLKLIISLIPFVITLIGIVIFALMYTITKEVASENRKKLLEMGI
jgi:GPH family glycoside/pentoside/hexuronide:cation symporter